MGLRVVSTVPLPAEVRVEVVGEEVEIEVPLLADGSREETINRVKSGGGANGLVSWTDAVDEMLLDACGDGLRVVANCAVGFDNIDLEACARRGVTACNTPDMVTDGTADIAWALLLGAARRVGEGDRFARSGAWAKQGTLGPAEFLGAPIAGQTLVIVGAGRIGYATALRSIGWGMKVLYVSRASKPAYELAPLNAERVTLEEGLERGDFISVHTPLTEETRHLIGERELGLCKATAVIVSTARGPVIDEGALARALRNGVIGAAGLDVFESEPRLHPELVELENTLFTPHIGSADTRCRRKMVELCAKNIEAVLNGREPLTPIAGS
ncbi:MAG: D-glycerate dehydrogenase [Planctomycetota bacterium]